MLADLRFALRMFARNPLFTAAMVLVLGLSVGATTTVFTLVDAYLLKPLPFPEPDRLVSVWHGGRADRSSGRSPFSEPDFVDLREQATSFSQLAAFMGVGANLSGGAGPGGAAPQSASGGRVSAEFFPLLGAKAAHGRVFTADEDRPGRDGVVVLSDALWRRRFGADPGAVGATVTLDGRPRRIVGVMPADFRGPFDLKTAPAEFWLPAAMPGAHGADRSWHSWVVLGRLKPGVSLGAADAEVEAVAARVERANPGTNTNKSFVAVSLHEQLVAGLKPALTLLFCATFLLLFIASANVALLLLARAAGREGEAAVRAALGASRARLVRQFLAEGLALALAGGALGFALAWSGVGLVAAGYEGAAPALREARPDGRVLAFVVALASLTGVGFGLLPALHASKARLGGLLKEGAARASAGAERRRTQAALLVAEIALSAVLLAGSAAVARGFYQALNRPMGFSTESALTFSVRLPETRYADAAAAKTFYEAFLGRLRATPAVSAAGAANFLPLARSRSSTGSTNGFFALEGKPPWAPGRRPWTMLHRVGGDYFAAMGMPIVRGRAFADADREKGAPVAIVSEAFARRFLPGEDPIGRRVRWEDDGGAFREVVGVVADVNYGPGWVETPTATYIPLAQEGSVKELNAASFVVRGGAEPRALADAAREALRQLDADLPLFDVMTYGERTDETLVDRRFTLGLVSSFALSALVLTALGLFGLVSYQTKRRSRELAIRMALGAAAADVMRLVLRDTARLLLAGLALGLPAALVAGRLLASELEGVSPADPLSLVGTALLLGAVALAAVVAPARRAAKTPPAMVLRDE